MRTRLLRPLRLGLPAAAVLALALTLTGCSEPAPADPAPTAAASPSTPAAAPAGGVEVGSSSTGSDGLTVRYLDGGSVKTVRVEDFPRR